MVLLMHGRKESCMVPKSWQAKGSISLKSLVKKAHSGDERLSWKQQTDSKMVKRLQDGHHEEEHLAGDKTPPELLFCSSQLF